MDIRDLKKVLKVSLEMESAYFDLCEECIKAIYKDNERKQEVALGCFYEDVESFTHNGCFRSLSNIMKQVEEHESRCQAWKAKIEAEKAEIEERH